MGEQIFTAFRFDVQLEVSNPPEDLQLTNPLCNAAFAECDGLEMTMQPKTFHEGGNNTEQIHFVGPVSYGALVLKRGMTPNFDLWKWFSAAVSNNGRGLTARGLVMMRNAEGVPTVRFTLSNCLPIKMKAPALNAKDGLLAIEELHLLYRSFQAESVS